MDGAVTLRHHAPGLSYELHLRPPSPSLRGLVSGLQGFAERTAGPLTRRELPTGDTAVILDLGDGWRVGGDRLGSFAGGPSDAVAFAGHDGRAECLQVDLTPSGVRALLGVPAGELTDLVVRLEDVLGPEAPRLLERLHAAPSWGARLALLDAALADRAADAPVPRPDVHRAWQRLRATGGAVPVETLARELGCSRRHLARRFAHDVGLGPKAFARVQRFARASALLRDADGPPLADVAAATGYADQAHLTREVRRLAGVTPSALRASVLPGGAGFAATPVPSVQDGAPLAA